MVNINRDIRFFDCLAASIKKLRALNLGLPGICQCISFYSIFNCDNIGNIDEELLCIFSYE